MFGLSWNSSVLQAVSVEEGPFLQQAGYTLLVDGTTNNGLGVISPPYACALTENSVNGTGVLAYVTFNVTGFGDSYLNLTDTGLMNANREYISFETVNGTFEEWRGVAVTDIVFSYNTTVVFPTWESNLDINVTVKNQGSTTENTTLTVYANTTLIGTENITNLAPLASTTLTFNWDVPDSIPKTHPYPTYVMKANTTAVANETDTTDNTLNKTVTVQWPGDCDGDGHVNQTDEDILSDSWMKSYPDPAYDPRADFDGDGIVQLMYDLIILSQNMNGGPLDYNVGIIDVETVLPYGASAVYPGWGSSGDLQKPKIKVTVENTGFHSPSLNFTVTAYYTNATGDYTIGAQNVTNLAPGANTTLTFIWDTTGVQGYVTYTIKAEISNVAPSDGNTADNTYTDGNIRVRWPGDTNDDGHVNYTDLYFVYVRIGYEYGDPNYDWRADMDGDGDVDYDDMNITGNNYGKGPLD